MAATQHYLLYAVLSFVWTIVGNCLSVPICNLSDPKILQGDLRLGPNTVNATLGTTIIL